MEYICYKRFRGKGIEGAFNLPYGTRAAEYKGFLFAPDKRCICAVTSENGWEHFRPATEEGEQRQALLEGLCRCFESGKGDLDGLYELAVTPETRNYYWKNLLRTLPTEKLEQVWRANMKERG